MQAQYRNYPPQAVNRASAHVTPHRRGPGPMVSVAHPPTMTLQQQQAYQQAEMQRRELAKRQACKPADKNLPDGIEHLTIGGGVQIYRRLLEMERLLDVAMMRKRLDMQENASRSCTRYRTMRIWISNTADSQPWQSTSMDPDAFDFNSDSQATYRTKIEGRLLDDDDDSAQEQEHDLPGGPSTTQRTRLSHFFKKIAITFDRSPSLQPDSYASIEWEQPETPTDQPVTNFDTLEFERKSDENINVTVNLFPDERPERYKLSPRLAGLLGTDEDDRSGIIMGLWIYIRSNKLQDEYDSRKVRCDAQLKALLDNRDSVLLPQIPQLINCHLTPLPPYQLPYTIRVDQSYIAPDDGTTPSRPTVYDVLVSLDDPTPAAMRKITMNPQTLARIASDDEQLVLLMQAIMHAKAKHTFFTALSNDPVNFTKRWISCQQRELDIMLGHVTPGTGEDFGSEVFRRGGPDSVWAGEQAVESVGLYVARSGRPN